jgi:hypothetical protein
MDWARSKDYARRTGPAATPATGQTATAATTGFMGPLLNRVEHTASTAQSGPFVSRVDERRDGG